MLFFAEKGLRMHAPGAGEISISARGRHFLRPPTHARGGVRVVKASVQVFINAPASRFSPTRPRLRPPGCAAARGAAGLATPLALWLRNPTPPPPPGCAESGGCPLGCPRPCCPCCPWPATTPNSTRPPCPPRTREIPTPRTGAARTPLALWLRSPTTGGCCCCSRCGGCGCCGSGSSC